MEAYGSYSAHDTDVWANLSLASGAGRTILSGQRLFSATTLAAAEAESVPLSTAPPVAGSGGVTHRFDELTVSAQGDLSSAVVRTVDPARPNGARGALQGTIAVAAIYHLRLAGRPVDLRLDLTNLTDNRAATYDASALEGGWTEERRGRAVIVGIEQGF